MARRTTIFVEGESDRVALSGLARRTGRSLDGVHIVAMGGATNIGAFLERYGAGRIAGLYDAAEAPVLTRALERAGYDTAAGLEALGFFACRSDLEEELIRALGPDAVMRVLERIGDLGAFTTFRKQPQWRDRPHEEQLHRFLGTKGGRKAEAARALVDALELDRVPVALADLLRFAADT
jgi:hypothetical protein